MSRNSKQQDFQAEMRVRGRASRSRGKYYAPKWKKALQRTYLIEKKRPVQHGDSLMTSSGVVVMEINLPKCRT